MSRTFKILSSIVVFVLLSFILFVAFGSKVYTDWLWFKNLDFLKTFWIMFLTNFWIRIIVGAIFTFFIFLNLSFTKKSVLGSANLKQDDQVETLFEDERKNILDWVNRKRLNIVYLLFSLIFGFLFSSVSTGSWEMVLKYLNQTPFNMVDPLFGKDVGFYVFSLPFLSFLKEMGMVLVILTLIFVGIIYILVSGIKSFNEMSVKLNNRVKTHITILISLFLLLKAWDYRLDMYELLFSPRGVAFGASYTDVHANLLGLRVLIVIVLAIAVALLVSIFRKKYNLVLWGVGLWLVASLIFGNFYPAFVQRFQVEPNEIAKEKKYINYNIDMTLKAYDLNNIKVADFNVNDKMTYEELQDNSATINNIKLWDARPLLSTYSQLQELRQYYNFINVDVNRYTINGDYQEVMLSAREMDQDRLSGQAKTWINQTLKYTHGYGLVMSPVNRITPEGLPEFYIKDIPPQTHNEFDLEVNNTSVYYGEKTNNYVITNNRSTEFHYPMGSENVYTNYDGNGGVPVSNLLRKSIFAVRFSNLKFLLSNDIRPESRVMYYRNIKERVRKAAPFLSYDSDPYLVLSEGRLFWIQDAYTTTNLFPYSQPTGRMGNYIRNSIKVVINAYNGSMDFYVIDENDPLAKTYQNIFTDLFVSGEEMPQDLRNHIRYPKDLFKIQSQLYSTYHMKDPMVFYNKEDLWSIPNEIYAGTSIQMEPYYIISKLPQSKSAEFLLIMPFTPATKNNMISWLAARNDGEHYGELFIYKFPKDKLVYGPMQIESRIDQDAEISQLLTLWSQRGSRVIRGNLLVIPVDNSILYVEPIYIQAETSELPELKRVVFGFGDKIVMRETLEQGINAIFGQETGTTFEEENQPLTALYPPQSLDGLTTKALEKFNQAQEAIRTGNWTRYGELVEELGQILEQMNNPTDNTQTENTQNQNNL